MVEALKEKLLFEQKYDYSIDDEMDNDRLLYLQTKQTTRS